MKRWRLNWYLQVVFAFSAAIVSRLVSTKHEGHRQWQWPLSVVIFNQYSDAYLDPPKQRCPDLLQLLRGVPTPAEGHLSSMSRVSSQLHLTYEASRRHLSLMPLLDPFDMITRHGLNPFTHIHIGTSFLHLTAYSLTFRLQSMHQEQLGFSFLPRDTLPRTLEQPRNWLTNPATSRWPALPAEPQPAHYGAPERPSSSPHL